MIGYLSLTFYSKAMLNVLGQREVLLTLSVESKKTVALEKSAWFTASSVTVDFRAAQGELGQVLLAQNTFQNTFQDTFHHAFHRGYF